MYFSAKEFHDAVKRNSVLITSNFTWPQLRRMGYTREQYNSRVLEHGNSRFSVTGQKVPFSVAAKYLSIAKKGIINRTLRDAQGNLVGGSKWIRPWSIVPALHNWRAPAGDFGVGVEIELGFNSREDAAFIVDKCKHMRYVTADFEGGTYPVEMTFPPVVYSKINSRTAFMRYLTLLNKEQRRVHRHTMNSIVGTHINVSLGEGGRGFAATGPMNNILNALPESDMIKYFGRRPYGYAFTGDSGKFIEWKLFNSTLDKKELKRYINIAVELTKLLEVGVRYDRSTVLEALERGYNKKGFTL